MAETLERGHVYFFYRPKVGEESPRRLADVQRFSLVLRPERTERWRLVIVGQKKLPRVDEHDRHWGFVDATGTRIDDLRAELRGSRYRTETRGERIQGRARPAGEGVYAIVRHGDHTHLAYVLEMPRERGEVQRAFNIAPAASFILAVKNPQQPSPPGAGLDPERKADYPQSLQRLFEGKRFIPADPVRLLDTEGAGLVLVGAEDEPDRELGVGLQEEAEHRAHLFSDLRAHDLPREPLTEGEWA